MALDTLTNVKNALGISATDQDTQIGALLEPLSALIEREAGRRFTSETVTERHPGGEATISLREFPVASITSVTDKVTGEVLSSDQFELEVETGLLRRLALGSRWATAGIDQAVYLRESTDAMRWEVVYLGGPATVPEDVKLALYLAIGANIDLAASTGGGAIGGIIAEKDGDYSYQRAAPAASTASALSATGLPAQSAAIARSYRAGVFI